MSVIGETTPTTKTQIPLVLTAVFLAYLGQMTLNPIIAPLAREVGLAEWQVGTTISTAAIMVVISSQFWGRRSQSWGRKPVLSIALGLATLAMVLFVAVSLAGMKGVLTGTALFAGFLALRGLMFGTAIAAIPPTAQAYIADVTVDEKAHVKGMAGVGAVQGIAMISGAVIGGGLAGFGLLTPLVAVPIFLGFGFLVITLRLRPEPRRELIADPTKVKPTDKRVWPFLLTAFGTLTALGFIQVIAGFIVQDRLGLDSQGTGLATGGVLLAAGLGMILAQTVIVPRSGLPPYILMRVGAIIALAGFLLMIPNGDAIFLVISVGLIGLGIGMITPGYMAGASLRMNRDEQGGLAGLVGAIGGLTFVVAPTLSTVLYGIWAPLPIIVGAGIMMLIVLFVFLYPGLKHDGTRTENSADPQPASEGTA